jgi:hypothetical protein
VRYTLTIVVSVSACGPSTPPTPAPTPTPAPGWSVRCTAVDPHPVADLHPTFELGAGQARGDLPAPDVQAALEAAATQIARCDADQRARTPQLAGTLETRFFINPAGTVGSTTTGVVAGPALEMQSVATCVDQVIAKLQFPSPRGGGGVLATYPIAFHPPRPRTFATEGREVADAVQRALATRLDSVSDCLEQARAEVAVAPSGLGSVVFDAGDRPKCDLSDLAVAYKPTEHTAVGCTFVASR